MDGAALFGALGLGSKLVDETVATRRYGRAHDD